MIYARVMFSSTNIRTRGKLMLLSIGAVASHNSFYSLNLSGCAESHITELLANSHSMPGRSNAGPP
jgi:hypothetical protein